MNQIIFKNLKDAENSIKSSVIGLSDQYINTIKVMTPVLKRASVNTQIEQKEMLEYQTLYEEATDHLHNLVQLKLELNSLSPDESNLILELSSEVLSNTIQFLRKIPTTN